MYKPSRMLSFLLTPKMMGHVFPHHFSSNDSVMGRQTHVPSLPAASSIKNQLLFFYLFSSQNTRKVTSVRKQQQSRAAQPSPAWYGPLRSQSATLATTHTEMIQIVRKRPPTT